MSQSGSTLGGGGGGGFIEFLTGNTGGPVGPFGNNIDLIGEDTIVVTGNPGTSTLTITDSSKFSASVTTNNAVPTELFGYAIAPNSATTLNVTISAVDSTFSEGAAATVVVGARAAGGAPTIIGLPNISISQDFGTPIAIDAVISGLDLSIQVTGIAATTIYWDAVVTFVTS